MLKIKQIGMLLVTMSAMLVLFAGCGDKDDGGDKESLATLVAETVSSSTTTNKISTQGPSGITFEATIVSQGGDAEWCSFDLNKQVSSAGGNVGDPAYLYLNKNNSDDDRTARIDVTYTNGYSTSLTLTQRAAGFIDYDRSWGEQPEYRSDDAYIYKTYYATFVSNQFFPGGKLRNYSVCYDVDRHISHWVAYPIFKKVYETPVLSRVNDFNYDPNDQLPVIPTRDQQYIGTGGNGRGYGARGYDRGHMLPQASRYNNYEPNRMTYYGTNMMPQNSTLNQNIWASLEGKVRGWGGLQTYDTLYVVTGAAFKSTKTIDNANGPIAVPSHCWKVLLQPAGQPEPADLAVRGRRTESHRLRVHQSMTPEPPRRFDRLACTVEGDRGADGFQVLPRTSIPTWPMRSKSQKNLADWPGIMIDELDLNCKYRL